MFDLWRLWRSEWTELTIDEIKKRARLLIIDDGEFFTSICFGEMDTPSKSGMMLRTFLNLKRGIMTSCFLISRESARSNQKMEEWASSGTLNKFLQHKLLLRIQTRIFL